MIHKRHRSDCRCWAHRSTEKWPECEWWLFVALRIRMYSINIDSWLRNGSFRLHSNQNTLPDVTHITVHRYAVLAYGFKLRNLCFGFTLISILSRWCHDVMTLFLTASFLTNFTNFFLLLSSFSTDFNLFSCLLITISIKFWLFFNFQRLVLLPILSIGKT